MTSFCAFCCKKFEARNATQEFCDRACYEAQMNAEARERTEHRRKMREPVASITGVHIHGGKQAINFENNADERRPYGR